MAQNSVEFKLNIGGNYYMTATGVPFSRNGGTRKITV